MFSLKCLKCGTVSVGIADDVIADVKHAGGGTWLVLTCATCGSQQRILIGNR